MSKARRLIAGLGAPLLAVVAALAVGAILIGTLGINPLLAYAALFLGALGNVNGVAETLLRASPLALAALGVMFAFRTGVFNIGAEGQLYLGAVATTVVAIQFAHWPRIPLLVLMIVASALAGGLWAAIPGYLRAMRGTNEIILTIMLNYVAALLVGFLLQGPLQAPGGQPVSPRLVAAAQAPVILPGTRLHAAVLLVPVLAAAAWVVLQQTALGLRLRAVGDTPGTARATGVSVPAMIILSMVFSGALAGLAGMGEITGVHHRLIGEFSAGIGYTSIAVALLGNLRPVGVVLSAIFFAALRVGAETMQQWAGVPASVVYVIQGLVVLFVIGGEFVGGRGLSAAVRGAPRHG